MHKVFLINVEMKLNDRTIRRSFALESAFALSKLEQHLPRFNAKIVREHREPIADWTDVLDKVERLQETNGMVG